MSRDGLGARGKRFAFLLPNLGGGGAERVALQLISDCLAAGHEVDLILARATGELLSLVPSDVRVFDLRAPRMRGAVVPLCAYLRDRQPDAVHVMMWPLTIAGIIACRLVRPRARILISEHGMLRHQYSGSTFNLLALAITTRALYRFADSVVCVSAQSAADLAAVSGLDRGAIEVIYNPVAAPPLNIQVPSSVEEMWGKGNARILSVGTLKAVKDHIMLIRAFARVARKRPATLIIVGEGEMRGALKHTAICEGVADNVHLPGFTLNPWPYYASADLFALSSKHEGFSLVLVEAMRLGLPVVSTDCPSGPREILEDGRYGSLTPVGDDGALAVAIEAALDHPMDSHFIQARAEKLSGRKQSDQYLALMLGENCNVAPIG